MARFHLKAHDRRGQDVSLIYDNQTSELLDSNGSPWPCLLYTSDAADD